MRFEVQLSSWQDLVHDWRVLASPGRAGEVLGIARPTVYDQVDAGRLLMWVFVRRGRHPKTWEHWIDFGPQEADYDGRIHRERSGSWRDEGGPEAILAQLVDRAQREGIA